MSEPIKLTAAQRIDVLEELRLTYGHTGGVEELLDNVLSALRDFASPARTPSSPATEPDERGERDRFEVAYCADVARRTHMDCPLSEVQALREGDHYTAANLNGCWQGWSLARALSAPTAPAPTEPVPENCDVRKILLDVVPGWDGMGEECYAESVSDVEAKLSEMGERLEEWEMGIRRIATPPSAAAQPEAVWRCFHCEEVFNDPDAARGHFGKSEYQQPGCQIDLAEYRRMEEVNRRHCEEDTDLHRAVYAAQGEGDEKARRAEEAGYARGLADAKKHPEELGLLAAAPTTEATSSPSDAERYRLVRRGQHWSVIDGIGNVLRGDELDAAIDTAIRATKGGKL